MPAIVKDFLSMTAVVGALSAFFVFASHKWIAGVEAEVERVRGEVVAHEAKITRLDAILSELKESLRRIENKLDRAVTH